MYSLGVSPHLFNYDSLCLQGTPPIKFYLSCLTLRPSLAHCLFLFVFCIIWIFEIALDGLNFCENIWSFNLWFLAVLDFKHFLCLHARAYSSLRYVDITSMTCWSCKKYFVFKLQMSHFAAFCELFRGTFLGKMAGWVKSYLFLFLAHITEKKKLCRTHTWFIFCVFIQYSATKDWHAWTLLTWRLLNCFPVAHLLLMWCKWINICA